MPEVRPIIKKIVDLKNQIESSPFERDSLINELGIQISKLEEKEIEVKDMDIGLIDFPAKRFDEPVYLCWKLGEAEVLYWHDMTGGFRGRRLLKPEVLKVR